MQKPITIKINIDKDLVKQSEIARRMKVSRSYVCQLISGKCKNPDRIKQINEIVSQLTKAA
jgi:predicted XRE-type DNA-binding protein